jgi:cytochrome c5
MLYKKKQTALAVIGISILIACSSALYMPSKENVAANSNIEELRKGRALYVSKCSSCHTLYLPEKYNKTEWAKWVDRMAPKAKITDQEKELIQAYLTKGE